MASPRASAGFTMSSSTSPSRGRRYSQNPPPLFSLLARHRRQQRQQPQQKQHSYTVLISIGLATTRAFKSALLLSGQSRGLFSCTALRKTHVDNPALLNLPQRTSSRNSSGISYAFRPVSLVIDTAPFNTRKRERETLFTVVRHFSQPDRYSLTFIRPGGVDILVSSPAREDVDYFVLEEVTSYLA